MASFLVVALGACGQVSDSNFRGGGGDSGPADGGGDDGSAGEDDAAISDICRECDGAKARCVEAASGAMECRCNPGYTGDGTSCTDVDECAFFGGGCDVNATCENTIGSYSCRCPAGSVGDGVTCRSGLIFYANGSSEMDRFFRSYDIANAMFTDEPLMLDANNDFCGCGYYHARITAAGGGLYYFANYGQQFRTAWGPASYPNDKRRGESGIAELDGLIYFIGGRGPQNNADVYDPGANTWSAISPYPIDIEWPAAGAAGGIIYVAGGRDADGATDFFSSYNPSTNMWTTLPAAPFTSSSPYGVGAGGVFWVFANGTLFSYAGATWTNLGALPVGNAKPAAVAGELYAVGDDDGGIGIYQWNGSAATGSWGLIATDSGLILDFWSHVGGTGQ